MEQNIIDRIKSNWNEVLDYIRNEFEIAEISFNIWISPLKPSYTEKDENGGTVLALRIFPPLFSGTCLRGNTLLIFL